MTLLTSNQCSWTSCPANQESQWTKEWSLHIWSPNRREYAVLMEGEQESKIGSWDVWSGATALGERMEKTMAMRTQVGDTKSSWVTLVFPIFSRFPWKRQQVSWRKKRFPFALGYFFFFLFIPPHWPKGRQLRFSMLSNAFILRNKKVENITSKLFLDYSVIWTKLILWF